MGSKIKLYVGDPINVLSAKEILQLMKIIYSAIQRKNGD